MHSRSVRTLRAGLVVLAMAAAVIGSRLALDALVGQRGWYIVVFLGTFGAARLAGTRAGVLVTLAAAGAQLLVPTLPIGSGTVTTAMVVDAFLDLLAGGAALALSLSLRQAVRRVRSSERAAEDRAGALLRAATREREARRLASEVAAPSSVRQLADHFARRAMAMLDAAGVVVMAGPATGARTAGGPSDTTLAVEGAPPVHDAVAAGAAQVASTTLPVRLADGSFVVPLLAGTGALAVAAIALRDGRTVDDDELEGTLLLGRIAGEAMARAGLAASSRHDAARAAAAAERIGRLQTLAAMVGRELDGEAIARLVVDAASDGTQSSTAVLSRTDPERGEVAILHARGYPVGLLERERRLPLAAELPAPTVARTGRPVAVDARGWTSEFPGASDLPAMAGLGQVVARPVGGPVPLGVLLVGRARPDAYEAEELAFLDAICEHAAQALRRALLVDLLRDRDRRLGLTLGVARAGTWELDVERDRIEVSGELRRLYGIGDEEPVTDLDAYLARIHPDDRDAVREAIRRAGTGGGPFTVEFRVPRPGTQALRVLGVGRTFADDTGRPSRLMAIDRDVTPERAAQAERERLLEQEREARRLSEAFFGVMSHELRTPVTTIIAASRLLGRASQLGAGERDLVEDISFEANRLHRLIDDLLVLSRIERGNLVLNAEPVHVGHLVSRVVAHEQRRWTDTRFRVGAPSREVIEGEETYVEQVLRNLLSNAAKYSPPGSTVDIEVARDGDEVLLRVLDEGAGVGADEVGDLFSLFYRSPATAAAASGAGIGLFVCERLIRAMGGRIWARRRPQGGSEFGFALRGIADDEEADAVPDGIAASP